VPYSSARLPLVRGRLDLTLERSPLCLIGFLSQLN
jgi:hypothetical protein